MLWLVLFLTLAVLTAVGVGYLITRFHKFQMIRAVGQKHKILGWICAVLPVAALFLFAFINIFAVIIVIVHLLLIWALCDLAALILRKCRKKECGKRYTAGITAILISVVYLSAGWFFAHHVFETSYTFETDKPLGGDGLRIVEIADLHLGITLDGEKFAKELENIQAVNPDLVAICGDFVDDDTEKEDLLLACEALGKLKTTYGVYFVYGNHDKGYYNSRDFSPEDLRAALTENGITVLEDEAVLVDDSFYVIGRKDRSDPSRMDMQTLVEGLDGDKYQILLDHQPNDYAKEEEAEVDLVLSGHTHGGHLFPAGLVGLFIKANDRVYGSETRGNTVFLVSSGISGWAIPFKTGCISEYVVIDVAAR